MQCPRACEETSYEIDVSSGALGNQKIFQKLSELKSYFKSLSEAKNYVRLVVNVEFLCFYNV